jgi:hypothetical protein
LALLQAKLTEMAGLIAEEYFSVEELVALLEPWIVAVDCTQGDDDGAGKVLPTLTALMKYYRRDSIIVSSRGEVNVANLTPAGTELLRCLRMDLCLQSGAVRHLRECMGALVFATFLDPRYRGAFVPDHSLGIDLVAARQDLEREAQRVADGDSAQAPRRKERVARAVSPKSARDDFLAALVAEGSTSASVDMERKQGAATLRKGVKEAVVSEVRNYLAGPRGLAGAKNPIEWWQNHGRTAFPTLEVVARTYLAMPASTARLERLFSSARSAACTHQRNNLNRDRYMMLRTNLIQRKAEAPTGAASVIFAFGESEGGSSASESDGHE